MRANRLQRRPFMLLLYTIETFCQVALNESRDFAPAGATFFSLVGKEGKSTPRGKGTLSNGSPSPLEPPTLRNDQRGAEAPRLDFPAEAACPFGHCRPRARHSTVSRGEVRTDEPTLCATSERTSTHSWGNPKGPRRALFGRRGEVQERGHSNCPLSCRRFCLLLPLLAKVSRPRRGETPALVAPAGAKLRY